MQAEVGSISVASYAIAARRSNLTGVIVGADECLRSWISAGIMQIKTHENSYTDSCHVILKHMKMVWQVRNM